MRILVVEDEEKLSGIIMRALESEGFSVDHAARGDEGLELARTYPYDLLILDIMLPGMQGSEVLAQLRTHNKQIPILILTARDAVADKVAHLSAGADDYLTKPFAFAELIVRVKALLRRAPSQRGEVLRVADLELNRLARQVRRAGQKIELSGKEYALLEYLMLHVGRVLSRTMIVEHVWDQSFEGLTNIVDVYIRQLRSKIDDDYPRKLIKTMRGAGYLITGEDA